MNDPPLETGSKQMRLEVHAGIQKFRVIHKKGEALHYAYETDGFAHFVKMDDANLPSNLSAPYFGYPSISDRVYQNTRNRILSAQSNPFYYTGKVAHGVGCPHTPKEMIWPLALIAQARTEAPHNMEQKIALLKMIIASATGDHRLHESFNADNANVFTRADFG